jgi:hypothetical protein
VDRLHAEPEVVLGEIPDHFAGRLVHNHERTVIEDDCVIRPHRPSRVRSGLPIPRSFVCREGPHDGHVLGTDPGQRSEQEGDEGERGALHLSVLLGIGYKSGGLEWHEDNAKAFA